MCYARSTTKDVEGEAYLEEELTESHNVSK